MNIEIGAGVGCLGRTFYSPCVETDINRDLIGVKSPSPIDLVCDAHCVSVIDDKFRFVIVCNPYPYGFVREEGIQLLRELVRIVKSQGKIILIASSLNPNCQPQRIREAVRSVADETGMKIGISVNGLDSASRYPAHRFRRLDGSSTIPDTQITLTVIK